MKPIQIGIIGLGTVGRGVFHVLARNKTDIARRAGRDIIVHMVAARRPDVAQLIIQEASPFATTPITVVEDVYALINSPDIDIVVELVGGCGVAKEWVLAAIAAGKHVVTANKALLAMHGTEIFAAAQANGVVVAFEAAVAGGIPIIKSLREGLSANRIEWIAGIINGTTNFILSEMRGKGLEFAVALRQAQALGYAEADPTFDIEGIDAAHKIALLSAMAFGVPVQFDKAHVEGIGQLGAKDIAYAEQLGYRIKLLGITKRVRHDAVETTEGIELRVHPCLVPAKRLMANVEGAMNAVMVHGDAVGTTLYCGKGAGAEPTASAVIADLVDITRLYNAAPNHHVPALAFQPHTLSQTGAELHIIPMKDVVTSYYLRLQVADQAGVLAKITGILAEYAISIDACLQREGQQEVPQAEQTAPTNAITDVIMLTHNCTESAMNKALATIQELPSVFAPIVRIRKEELV